MKKIGIMLLLITLLFPYFSFSMYEELDPLQEQLADQDLKKTLGIIKKLSENFNELAKVPTVKADIKVKFKAEKNLFDLLYTKLKKRVPKTELYSDLPNLMNIVLQQAKIVKNFVPQTKYLKLYRNHLQQLGALTPIYEKVKILKQLQVYENPSPCICKKLIKIQGILQAIKDHASAILPLIQGAHYKTLKEDLKRITQSQGALIEDVRENSCYNCFEQFCSLTYIQSDMLEILSKENIIEEKLYQIHLEKVGLLMVMKKDIVKE